MARSSPSSSSRHSTKTSVSSTSSTSSSRSSRRSKDSHSTTGTTPQSSPRCSPTKAYQDAKIFQHKKWTREDDASPSTSYCDRASTDTFDSTLASDDENDDIDMGRYDTGQEIPPLPEYRRDVVDPTVRPSTPEQFGRLFPSTEKLSIRHDEFTSDGNMNLRVDMVVPGRRRVAVQLFHLRMHDLAKRKFSLRRYCRESGREVCNSERKYEGTQAPGAGLPTLQQSVSTAFKFRRTNSGGSLFGSKPSHSSSKRPGSSSSADNADDEVNEYFNRAMSLDRKKVPTNTIKLEFSNYARVDVTRKGSQNSKHYNFEWWGHSYSWNRVYDKNLRVNSFHLVRDGTGAPVAHIVPESRSPTQAFIDESAGGWVPPCHMWISDESVIDVPTDVADVLVATGLMALVDNCIKERWQTKKSHRISVPLTSKTFEFDHRKVLRPTMLHAAHSDHHGGSPLRYAGPISAY